MDSHCESSSDTTIRSWQEGTILRDTAHESPVGHLREGRLWLLDGARGASIISCHTRDLEANTPPGFGFTLPPYLAQSPPSPPPPLPISLASYIIPENLAILASFWISRPCNPPQTLLRTSSLLILGSSLESCQHQDFLASLSPYYTQRSLFSSQNPLSMAYTPLSLAFQIQIFELCELPISKYAPPSTGLSMENGAT